MVCNCHVPFSILAEVKISTCKNPNHTQSIWGPFFSHRCRTKGRKEAGSRFLCYQETLPSWGLTWIIQWLWISIFISLGVVHRLKLQPWSHMSLLNASFLEGYRTGQAEGEKMLLEIALIGGEECRLWSQINPTYPDRSLLARKRNLHPSS